MTYEKDKEREGREGRERAILGREIGEIGELREINHCSNFGQETKDQDIVCIGWDEDRTVSASKSEKEGVDSHCK